MSSFRQGATYEQIQEWIKEKNGFHVSHLNIAKTKRKCGIIERENYNLPDQTGFHSEHLRITKNPSSCSDAFPSISSAGNDSLSVSSRKMFSGVSDGSLITAVSAACRTISANSMILSISDRSFICSLSVKLRCESMMIFCNSS